MSSKKIIGFSATIGSIIGGYLPSLWGDDGFSTVAVLFTFFGGLLGVYLGYKIAQNY